MQSIGSFRGTVVDGAVSATTNGYAQVVLKVHADEMYDEEAKEWGPWEEFDWEPNEIDDRTAMIYACVFGSKGATFVVDDVKAIFGWDGTSLGVLDGLLVEGTKIQWANAYDTYDGNTKVKADGIKEYDASPGGSIRRLDAKGLKDLDAKFAGFLKGETKPEKAKSGTRKARKTATEAAKGNKTEEAKADKPKRGKRGESKKAATMAPPEEASEPPIDPVEKDETVQEQADAVFANNGPCTKNEAWTDINAAKGDGVTDGDVSSAWLAAIQDVGGGKKQKELTDDDWGSVRAAVIDVVAVF